jgi:hypothetical protein
MTNLYLAILSTVLTLAILGALWHVKNYITCCIGTIGYKLESTERSLRSHVNDEMDQIQTHTTSLAVDTFQRLKRTEKSIVDFVTSHAEDLRKHAEDLRNHAKDLSDRAEVQSASPRQAVTRN